MGKQRNQGKRKEEESDYDSDDSRAYRKEKEPDPSSREYFYDDVDEFHANRDKISLERGGVVEPADSSENEEEILGWDDEENEEDAFIEERLRKFRRQEKLDEIASDLEDEEGDGEGGDEGIDAKSWGRRKQDYYGTDYVDDDLPGLDQAEEEEQQDAEEEEALAIQTRLAEALQEEDFGLDLFKVPNKQLETVASDDALDGEKVTKDLSKLSKREKLEVLKKESPEFLELTADFMLKMGEMIDRLQPLMSLIKAGRIEKGSDEAQYLHTKYQLYLSYCMNISFYMILKAKHIPVANHPVIGRIVAFRKLISELQPVDDALRDEIETLLASAPPQAEERDVQPVEDEKEKVTAESREEIAEKKSRSRRRKRKSDEMEQNETELARPKKIGGHPLLTEEECKALEFYQSLVAKHKKKKAEMANAGEFDREPHDEGGDEENEKRGITYQISKNRGLTTHKRKELRTPRVKNRMKYRKAKIRRKGQVRQVRTEMQRYGGEASGIRSSIIKSIKIK